MPTRVNDCHHIYQARWNLLEEADTGTENPRLDGLSNSDKVSARHQRSTSLTHAGVTGIVNWSTKSWMHTWW